MFMPMLSWRFGRWPMPTRSCGRPRRRFMRMVVFGRSWGIGGVPIRPRRRTRGGIVLSVRAGPTGCGGRGTFVAIFRWGWSGYGHGNGERGMTSYPRRAGWTQNPDFLTWWWSAFRPKICKTCTTWLIITYYPQLPT